MYPDTWPLPLSVHGMAAALTNPVPQPLMAVDANGAPVMALPPAGAGHSGRKRSAEGAAVRGRPCSESQFDAQMRRYI